LIILCKKCKLPFDNGENIQRRVCPRLHPKKPYDYKENKKFWFFIQKMRLNFQDPIYQYFRLLDDEWIRPSEKRKLNVEAITAI